MIQSRSLAKLLVAFGTAIAALALLVPLASAAEPKEGFKQFKGCPSQVEAPAVETCERVHIDGGYVKLGSKTVTIENAMNLIAGVDSGGNFVGGVFPPVAQKVPGGVIGVTGLVWLLEFFGVEALSLYATTELAGVPGNAFIEPITLPVKVHLTTPSGVLGKNCYIGSTTTPLKFNLQIGPTSPPPPNESISGIEPTAKEENNILYLENGQFVDNSFAAPSASGCVLTLFGFIPLNLDSLVNSQSGLPAAAGTNETRQNFDIEATSVSFVY